jgi:hypothetical protein
VWFKSSTPTIAQKKKRKVKADFKFAKQTLRKKKSNFFKELGLNVLKLEYNRRQYHAALICIHGTENGITVLTALRKL